MQHGHVARPEDFFDRTEDRARLASLVRAGHNVLVYGPRRIGKTALLARLGHELADEVVFMHRDCSFFTDPQDLANGLYEAIGASGIARWARFKKAALEAARGLRIAVAISDEGITPQIQLGTPAPRALEDALQFLSRIAEAHPRPIVLSLDEFQEVMLWQDKTVAMLRAYVQLQPKLQVVLTGSKPSILLALTHAKNPFYRQLTECPIGPVDLREFVAEFEARHGIVIEEGGRALLEQEMGRNTMELVHVLDILRTVSGPLDDEAVRLAMANAIRDNAPRYERILHHEVRSPRRRRILFALAVEQPAQPFSQAFAQTYRLGAVASVQKAIEAFQDIEVLDHDRRFHDPLFRLYLAQNAPF